MSTIHGAVRLEIRNLYVWLVTTTWSDHNINGNFGASVKSPRLEFMFGKVSIEIILRPDEKIAIANNVARNPVQKASYGE